MEQKEDTTQKKEAILNLIDKIEDPKTQKKLLKLFTAIFIGAADKTKQYFIEVKEEFENDQHVKALLISLAYVFQMHKIFPEGKTSAKETPVEQPSGK